MTGGKTLLKSIFLVEALLAAGLAFGDEPPAAAPPAEAGLIERYTKDVARGIDATIDRAIELIGVRYRRGGQSPESGFDCSGFVRHVFNEGLGLVLPHNAREMSKSGQVVQREELKPGDLVFFRTLRRTISHVGIYLGENRFIHAPATGGEVRVEDMSTRYWAKRFAGARRVEAN